MSKEHRHHKLLENNPKVAKWIRDQTPTTGRSYTRTLGLFCERTKTTPSGLLKLTKERLVEVFRDYAATLMDKHGLRPAGATARKAIVSWLNYNFREEQAYALKAQTKGLTKKAAIGRREFVALPTQSELGEAFAAASPKVRVSMAFMGFAGQRIGVLGDGKRDDGLRFSDLPEASFDEDGALVFEKFPTVVMVRTELSKTSKAYFAFLSEEGCKLLQSYVSVRVAGGEKVTKDSAVYAPDVVRRRGESGKGTRVAFVHPNNIGDAIRAVFVSVGIGKMTAKGYVGPRPYELRHYFSQNATRAIREGLNGDWKEFWMGHDPKVRGLYELRDAVQLQERMRENYGLLVKYVSVSGQVQKNIPARVDVLKAILAASGQFSDEDLAKWDETKVIETGQALLGRVRETAETEAPVAAKPAQRIVTEQELDALLAEGWVVVSVLPSGRVVVKSGGP